VAAEPAATADYTREFLDLVIAVRVVPSLDGAIATINRDSSAHSDAIVTSDKRLRTGSWQGSTRGGLLEREHEFNDGFEFALAPNRNQHGPASRRGPWAAELCSYKWQVTGTGQVRVRRTEAADRPQGLAIQGLVARIIPELGYQ